EGIGGLALALVVASALLAPVGVAAAGTALAAPAVASRGLAVALLSTVVPYSLEVVALRRTSARAFGVALSVDPAVAAVAGLVVLGQALHPLEWTALGLVVAANLGSALEGAARPVEVAP
ncbi:MAG TPA: EamA family transporter, partial [Acidimicrobiales bacterium]|nr:EamA family transporter [Acidimicrobiales bacterium]